MTRSVNLRIECLLRGCVKHRTGSGRVSVKGRSRSPSPRDAQPRAQVLRHRDWQAPSDRDRTFALPAIELGSTAVDERRCFRRSKLASGQSCFPDLADRRVWRSFSGVRIFEIYAVCVRIFETCRLLRNSGYPHIDCAHYERVTRERRWLVHCRFPAARAPDVPTGHVRTASMQRGRNWLHWLVL